MMQAFRLLQRGDLTRTETVDEPGQKLLALMHLRARACRNAVTLALPCSVVPRIDEDRPSLVTESAERGSLCIGREKLVDEDTWPFIASTGVSVPGATGAKRLPAIALSEARPALATDPTNSAAAS